jgi:hypothetical protein
MARNDLIDRIDRRQVVEREAGEVFAWWSEKVRAEYEERARFIEYARKRFAEEMYNHGASTGKPGSIMALEALVSRSPDGLTGGGFPMNCRCGFLMSVRAGGGYECRRCGQTEQVPVKAPVNWAAAGATDQTLPPPPPAPVVLEAAPAPEPVRHVPRPARSRAGGRKPYRSGCST